MREASQEKGRHYAKLVKEWFARREVYGLDAIPRGDTYDATRRFTCIGGEWFDLSFSLDREDTSERILYMECKFRSDRRANTTTEFKGFLKRVYSALQNAPVDERDESNFLFVATCPPCQWLSVIHDFPEALAAQLERTDLDRDVVAIMSQHVEALVLRPQLIGD